jgi:hypothetical protein
VRRALLLLVVACACGPVDLVVVDVPDGGDFVPPDTSCTTNEDCLGGQYCSKPGCSAALGVCRQRPVSCNGEHAPECGCNGVTYFNACLRRAEGVSMREPGLCDNPRRCDTTSPCQAGQFCARFAFMPNECNLNVAGACWALPEVQCTYPAQAQTPPPTFVPCGGGVCMEVCAAVRREQPVLLRPRNAGPCP